MAIQAKLEPIVPKRPIIDARVAQRVPAVMRQAGGDLAARMRKYPPARPWKNPPPKTGPRAGGRRTGRLARGWRLQFPFRAGFTLGNQVGYSGHVQGFAPSEPVGARQTSVMAGRGWQRLDIETLAVIEETKPRLRVAFSNRRR